MRKGIEKRGTKKIFTFYDDHLDMLDTLLKEKHGFGSESDIIRQALSNLYRAIKPPYRTETAMGRKRAKELDKEKVIEDMPDERYAIEVMKGIKKQDAAGKQFILIHQLGNSVGAVPLEGVKKWAEDNDDLVQFHLEKLKDTPLESMLSSAFIQQILHDQYGIVFE